MANPFIAPAVISGASNLIGGLMGGSDSGRISSDQWEMYDSQQGYTDARNYTARAHANMLAKKSTGWQFDDLMNSADESGIHRLAALGGASAYQSPGQSSISPGIPAGSPGGKSNLIGDAVGEGMRAFRESRELKMAEKESSARVRLLKSEADQIDAATSRSQISSQRAATTGGPNNAREGTRENPLQTHVWGKDPRTGKEGWMVNPALPDTEQIPIAQGAGQIWVDDPHSNARPLTRKEYNALRTRHQVQTKELKKGAVAAPYMEQYNNG